MIELFQVTSVIKQYRGCKDVTFSWFRNEPATGRPYRELVEDYQDGDSYQESYIDEAFTREEACALQKYLEDYYGSDLRTTIEHVDLPARTNVAGITTIAVGGADDFYMLDKAADYPLSFSVWGYFNLLGCQMIDGSGEYQMRLTVLFPDGTFQKLTSGEINRLAEESPHLFPRGDLPF